MSLYLYICYYNCYLCNRFSDCDMMMTEEGKRDIILAKILSIICREIIKGIDTKEFQSLHELHNEFRHIYIFIENNELQWNDSGFPFIYEESANRRLFCKIDRNFFDSLKKEYSIDVEEIHEQLLKNHELDDLLTMPLEEFEEVLRNTNQWKNVEKTEIWFDLGGAML